MNRTIIEKEILMRLRTEHQSMFTINMQIGLVIYVVLIELTGITGNGMILYVFTKAMKKAQLISSSTIMILLLAVADLIAIVICLPYQLKQAFAEEPLNSELCKATSFMNGVTFSLQILILLSLAVDRYIAIVNPLRYKILMSIKRLKICLLVNFILAICNGFANMFSNDTKYYDQEYGIYIDGFFCQNRKYIGDSDIKYLSIAIVVLLIFLFTAILTLYSLVYYKIRSSRVKNEISQSASIIQKSQFKQQMLAAMLLASSILLFASWIPFMIMQALKVDVNHLFYYFLYINNITNFFVFFIINRNFRHDTIDLYKNWFNCCQN